MRCACGRLLSLRRPFSSSRQTANHYQTLNVPQNATRIQIKQAFHKLSKTYHPDLGTASSSERRFAEISEAYNTLSNESQRRNYDRSLATSSAFASGGYTTNAARHSTANYAWAHARRHNASSYAHFRRPAGGASSTSSSRRHDYTEQLFDRMQARADRMSNLWGTQMNRERMQSQQRAWDAANQEATSTTKRVAQIIGALVLVSMVSHVTRVSAETNAEKVTLIRRDIAKGANIQHIQSPLDRALHRMSAKDLEGHATSTLPDSMLDQDRQDTQTRTDMTSLSSYRNDNNARIDSHYASGC